MSRSSPGSSSWPTPTGNPPSVPYDEVDLPDPGDLENMPDAADAPAEPAGPPRTVDLDAITVPDLP